MTQRLGKLSEKGIFHGLSNRIEVPPLLSPTAAGYCEINNEKYAEHW